LTADEIARLFSVAPAWRQLAYAVAIATGLRLSELRRIDRADLDTENSRLRLRWRQTKNRKDAYCYLPSTLIAALAEFADSGVPARCTSRPAPERHYRQPPCCSSLPPCSGTSTRTW
jgi:integrase